MPSRTTLSRVALAVAAAAVVAGTGAIVITSSGSPSAVQASGPHPAPAPAPQALVERATGDVVPWDQPLTVSVTHGRLTSVTVLGPDSLPVPGTLAPTAWTSTTTLLPRASYQIHVELTSDD